MNKLKTSTLENSFTSQNSSTLSTQAINQYLKNVNKKGRPPLTLKVNEINVIPQKEGLNLEKNEKMNNQKQKISQPTMNQTPQNSNKKSTKNKIIETDSVIQEFEKLKLKILQRIQKNQIVQQGYDPRVLRDQIHEQIYILIADNLKLSKNNNNDCQCQRRQSINLNDNSLFLSNVFTTNNAEDPLQISTVIEESTLDKGQEQEINKLKEENAQLVKQKELEYILQTNLVHQIKNQVMQSSLDYELKLQNQDLILQKLVQQLSQPAKQYSAQNEQGLLNKNTPVNIDNYQAVNHVNYNYNNEQEEKINNQIQDFNNYNNEAKQQQIFYSKVSNSPGSSSPNSNQNTKQNKSQDSCNEVIIDSTLFEINQVDQNILNNLSSLEKELGPIHSEFHNIKNMIQLSNLREKLQKELNQSWKHQINKLQLQLSESSISTWNTRYSNDSSQQEFLNFNERNKLNKFEKEYPQSQYLNEQNSENEIQEKLNNLFHKENALRRRHALLKKKELAISLNEQKLKNRIQQYQKDDKLLDQRTKQQQDNENQLNKLWQDFFKEIERIFKQIYQTQDERNIVTPQSQQAIISIQKVQTMIQGYISKTVKDKDIIQKERDVLFQLRRDLESQRKDIEMERFELNQQIESSNKDLDIKSRYTSIQQ